MYTLLVVPTAMTDKKEFAVVNKYSILTAHYVPDKDSGDGKFTVSKDRRVPAKSYPFALFLGEHLPLAFPVSPANRPVFFKDLNVGETFSLFEAGERVLMKLTAGSYEHNANAVVLAGGQRGKTVCVDKAAEVVRVPDPPPPPKPPEVSS